MLNLRQRGETGDTELITERAPTGQMERNWPAEGGGALLGDQSFVSERVSDSGY